MQKTFQIQRSLSFRLIFWVGLILLACIATWAYFDIRFQRKTALEGMVSGVERLGNTIWLGIHYAMMLNSPDDLRKITKDVAQNEIESVRIFNKEGRIKFSNLAEEVECNIDIQTKSCAVCHLHDPPLEKVGLWDRVRIRNSGQGRRSLSLIKPIPNEPGCASVSCHFHPSEKKILGFVDLVVSMDDLDRETTAYERRIFGLAIALFLGSSTIIGLFLVRSINQPIQKLITETRRIGNGEYHYEVDASRNDEIGQLAEAINQMRMEIAEKHEELKQNWYEYQRLFEEAPCYITVQDRDLKIIRYNREFEEHFSPTAGDYCFKAYKGRTEKCEICPVLKVFKDGKSHYSEESKFNKDGSESYWLVKASPIRNSAGQVTAAMEMSLDVTQVRALQREVKESEEKYRTIFNTIPHPLFVLSEQDFTILDCNNGVTAVYGFQKEEILGTSFLDLFEETERRKDLSKMRVFDTIERARQKRKDGSIIYVNIRISASEYSDRRVLLVTTSDVTSRLLAEQHLIQASKLATLGEMATGMAHELNQPLSVIKTASSFLHRKVVKGESLDSDILRTMSEEIDGHVDKASRIINHMREFGRKSGVSKERVQINEVLMKSLDFFKQQLKLREIEIAVDLDPDLPCIMADANRLEQVFINLLINARYAIDRKWEKSRPEEAKRIVLKTGLENEKATATISDNGTGIPSAILEKIFEPFFTTKTAGKGTGLGLSISYGIVRDYDGTIGVTSREGEGTSFVIRFPIARDVQES